ncbi:MAG TPA: hypothetical protein VJT15_14995 [Pyrinomonadaceae bacterium]|nr:hypothetical protein [Pyrinomonadaceae bacterium]
MRNKLVVLFLLGSLAGSTPASASAQISTTGPAGLLREMPRIYGPHMANKSRIANQQKKKQRRTTKSKTRRPRKQSKATSQN